MRGTAMYRGRIEAAEEIQLLLPENQPEPAKSAGLLLGLGVLLVALPVCGLSLRAATTRPPVSSEN